MLEFMKLPHMYKKNVIILEKNTLYEIHNRVWYGDILIRPFRSLTPIRVKIDRGHIKKVCRCFSMNISVLLH